MLNPSTVPPEDLASTQIASVLRSVDEHPTPAAYTRAARDLRALAGRLRPVRICLVSTFTIDPLVAYLEVEAARAGFAATVHVVPQGTVQQALLNRQSDCRDHSPDVVFVAQLLGDVVPALADDFLALDDDRVAEQVDEAISHWIAAVTAFRRHTEAAVVLHNFALPRYPLLGIYEASAPASQTEAIRRVNRGMVEAARRLPGVHVLDFDRLCAQLGYRHWQDDTMWYLGRAPLSPSLLPLLGQTCAAYLRAILGAPRKCLVLDLDNTLWGGVIGEDGLSGIQLGHCYPGTAYCDLQRALVQLSRRGIILAMNSKNNPEEVDEAFRSHPDMVLKREHFAAARINWRSKPENMCELAEELNLGLDSFVFLDDNPVECEAMRRLLPEVLTLEACDAAGRPDPLRSLRLLQESGVFDKLSFTAEDRRRGVLYQQQAARRSLEHAAASLDEFLRDLQMTVVIREVDAFALPRVLDLIQKTNQFNLTTRRHSAARLEEFVADPSWGVFALRLHDRYGDQGIVGAALAHLQGDVARMDTFLLSCRVMGRNVETALLHHLAAWARRRKARRIEGEFIPTKKNAPAADFYPRHGFVEMRVPTDDGSRRWELSLETARLPWPACIKSIDDPRSDP